jgi:hypothetical protein
MVVLLVVSVVGLGAGGGVPVVAGAAAWPSFFFDEEVGAVVVWSVGGVPPSLVGAGDFPSVAGAAEGAVGAAGGAVVVWSVGGVPPSLVGAGDFPSVAGAAAGAVGAAGGAVVVWSVGGVPPSLVGAGDFPSVAGAAAGAVGGAGSAVVVSSVFFRDAGLTSAAGVAVGRVAALDPNLSSVCPVGGSADAFSREMSSSFLGRGSCGAVGNGAVGEGAVGEGAVGEGAVGEGGTGAVGDCGERGGILGRGTPFF